MFKLIVMVWIFCNMTSSLGIPVLLMGHLVAMHPHHQLILRMRKQSKQSKICKYNIPFSSDGYDSYHMSIVH